MFCKIWPALPRAGRGNQWGRRRSASHPHTALPVPEPLRLHPASPAGAPLVSCWKNVLLAGIWQPGLWRGGSLSAYRGSGSCGLGAAGRGFAELWRQQDSSGNIPASRTPALRPLLPIQLLPSPGQTPNLLPVLWSPEGASQPHSLPKLWPGPRGWGSALHTHTEISSSRTNSPQSSGAGSTSLTPAGCGEERAGSGPRLPAAAPCRGSTRSRNEQVGSSHFILGEWSAGAAAARRRRRSLLSPGTTPHQPTAPCLHAPSLIPVLAPCPGHRDLPKALGPAAAAQPLPSRGN